MLKWVFGCPYVMDGSGVLAVSQENEFLEMGTGEWGYMVDYIDDVRLRGSPSDFPMSHLHPSHHGIGEPFLQ